VKQTSEAAAPTSLPSNSPVSVDRPSSWQTPSLSRPHLPPCSALGLHSHCVQYQLSMRDLILDKVLHATPELPIDSEWERVNLAICRGLWALPYPEIIALTSSLHVNGDGRSAAERRGAPYEPGAHGSTCTIGPNSYEPIDFYNRAGNLGPY
jgi:hypothetical protein